jgi:hypothetical protein
MSAADYLGFVLDATEQAASTNSSPAMELNSTAGSEEKQAEVKLLVEDTYVRLGFLLTGITRVVPFVDGAAGTAITITSCPIVDMAMSFVCQSEGTNDPIVSLDWAYCVQLR